MKSPACHNESNIDENKEAVNFLFEYQQREDARFAAADERRAMSEVWQTGRNEMN